MLPAITRIPQDGSASRANRRDRVRAHSKYAFRFILSVIPAKAGIHDGRSRMKAALKQRRFSDGVGDDGRTYLRVAPEGGLDRPCKPSDLHGPGRAGGLPGEYVLLDSGAKGEDWNAPARFVASEDGEAVLAPV